MNLSRFLIVLSLIHIFIFIAACHGDNSIQSLERESNEGDLPTEYVNKETKIVMKTEKSIYSMAANEIKITVENQGSNPLSFGTFYRVEKFKEGTWYEVPFEKKTEFNDIQLSIKANESYNQEVLTKLLNYHLTQGLYRIVKEFESENEDFKIAAEFTIDKTPESNQG
ncbi:immunoglobulin-like domain-containing protein [Pontibacillus yanchengensis]|uniref:Bacterial Ig-like domain-containing protein n=1 Tax=Pontibacillus yanchengensis Y32 TaxID=1385514 RepID=A0A0A2TVZ8_9BACI|nr:immunoglobulin-like domain-containing protein [Pontibacillus yanchengensis]KGP73460.1 hypothetical protein N782_05090 [Pontibacillus yanchengensis Y32]